MERTIHHGRNVKRFREMLGIKQETLANELGEDWNQRKISLLEGKEKIEDDLLEKLANILQIPGKAIQNFDEEKAINMIADTINNHDDSSVFYNSTINCTERWLDAIEENKRLYERLLKDKEETIALLRSIIDKATT